MISCTNDTPFYSEFERRMDVWNSSKKEKGNSYSYTTSFDSVSRFGSTTAINVNNGTIISRSYKSYGEQDGEKVVISNGVEN